MNIYNFEKLFLIKIKYKDRYNNIKDTILNDNKICNYDKLRLLNLFSVYQRTLKPEFPKDKKFFILDKTFLDKYYYKEINDLLNTVQNVNINFYTQNRNIEFILDESNFKKLKSFGEAIYSKIEEYKNYEEIILTGNKKDKIYKEIIIIDNAQFELFKDIFDINIKEIEYQVIKNKDILIIKDEENSLNMIIIGNFYIKYKCL